MDTGELRGRCWVKGKLQLRMIFGGVFLLKTKVTELEWPRHHPQAPQLKDVHIILYISSCRVSQTAWDCIWFISFYQCILVHVVSWFVCIQRNVIPCDSFYLRLFPYSPQNLWNSLHLLIARPFLLQLSILVHPDKNQDDADRAQKAFEGNALTLFLGWWMIVVGLVFSCSWFQFLLGVEAVELLEMKEQHMWGGFSLGGSDHIACLQWGQTSWDCSRKTV